MSPTRPSFATATTETAIATCVRPNGVRVGTSYTVTNDPATHAAVPPSADSTGTTYAAGSSSSVTNRSPSSSHQRLCRSVVAPTSVVPPPNTILSAVVGTVVVPTSSTPSANHGSAARWLPGQRVVRCASRTRTPAPAAPR